MSRTCPECSTSYEDEILHCPEDGLDLTALEPDDELIGRTIGSYQVTKMLGKGGMGSVYMAQHPGIGSKVAIKFLHPQFSADKRIVDRFFNEARAVNVIGHDNILKILDLNVTEDSRHYFVMEFLYGKPLQELVEPDKPLPLDMVGPILLQCCEALLAAHESGIIHRDLKPDNVYLTVHKGRKNFVKVVDFGIAKLTDTRGQSTGKTQTGMVMGTPAYMSPEQAGGLTTKIDARSDVYSLGVMMFQMSTGKLPFPGQSFGEVLIGHLQLPPPPPRSIAPDIPEEYEAIILKCLEKKQEDRYQSMRDLYQAVHGCMDRLGISAELPIATPADLPPGVSKSDPGVGLKHLTPARPTRPPKKVLGQTGEPARPQPTPVPAALAPAPPSSRPHTAIIAAVGAVIVVALAGIGYMVWDSRRGAAAAAEAMRLAALRAQEDAEQKVRAARDAEARRPAEAAQTVTLFVVSDPLGADVEATWNGGKKQGVTAFNFDVPRNTKVHLEMRKPGYVPNPYQSDVFADSAQTVTARLTAEPKVVAATPLEVRKKPKKDKK